MDDPFALVTGATGFIGTHLTKTLLQSGWRVRATRRSTSSTAALNELGCQDVVLDLTNYESVLPDTLRSEVFSGITHVFHVAGQVAGTAAQLDRVNRQGTRVLLSSMVQHAQFCNRKPPVFLLVSSAAAGGPSPPGHARKTSDLPQPVSNYGRSKLAAEIETLQFADQAPVTIARPGIVFGDGDREFIKLFKAMRRILINPMIGFGTQPLGMIEVTDLVELLIKAATNGQRCEATSHSTGTGIYAAADPCAISLRQLGQIYRTTLGRPTFNLPLPPAAGWLVATCSEFLAAASGKPSTLNRDKIREATAPGWVQDCSTTIQQIGWQPAKSIEQRLADTLRNAAISGRL